MIDQELKDIVSVRVTDISMCYHLHTVISKPVIDQQLKDIVSVRVTDTSMCYL